MSSPSPPSTKGSRKRPAVDSDSGEQWMPKIRIINFEPKTTTPNTVPSTSKDAVTDSNTHSQPTPYRTPVIIPLHPKPIAPYPPKSDTTGPPPPPHPHKNQPHHPPPSPPNHP